ncbi:MAG: hypothetical protein ACOC2K_04575, partial [Bacteroidota bacterium]
MKARTFITALVLIFSAYALIAEEPKEMNNDGGGIGLYGQISGSYSELMSKPAYYLGLRAGLHINDRWTIGLGGSALNYDRTMDELV